MVRLHEERVGDLHAQVYSPAQPPLKGVAVMIHGACLSGKLWHRWAEKLALRGIEVWCPDLRGHGQSPGAPAGAQAHIEDYVADIAAVIDASGGQALVGHDMGGLIAQILATRYPLKGVVLVDTVTPRGVGGPGAVLSLWRELRPRYIKAVLQGSPWSYTEEDLAALSASKLPPDECAEVASWLCPESGSVAREMSLIGVPVDETKIACPVLVVATTFDTFTPPSRQRQISSRYRADYVEFAQHAHFPMLEPGWERPVAVVGRWLEEAARMGETSRSSIGRMAAARRSASGTPIPGVTNPTKPDGET